MNPFGLTWKLLGEATKNVTQAPGWVPLGLLCYVTVATIAESRDSVGRFVQPNKEAIALGLTALVYVLGDALDTLAFGRFRNVALDNARSEIRVALGVSSGYYAVSKAIATSAGEYGGSRIQVANEAAKFFRSTVFLALPAGVLMLANGYVSLGLLTCAATLALFGLYVHLKQLHMRLLYERVARVLSKDSRMCTEDLRSGVRMFFWAGEFAASASCPAPRRADA